MELTTLLQTARQRVGCYACFFLVCNVDGYLSLRKWLVAGLASLVGNSQTVLAFVAWVSRESCMHL